jgi:hypothetical protein
MAQFSLKDTVNRLNNPSSNGIFEYGKYDLNTLAFTRFTTYGYNDGSPVDYNNLDRSKILGWYDGVNEFPHLSFENIQNNSNISPQPFPSTGIYMHPSAIYTGFHGDVGVRVNIPYNASLAILPGSTIQKADTNCGDNISFRVRKNGTTDVLPLTIIPNSSTPTPLNLSALNLVAGDYIDIIGGHGNPNDNEGCDDISLNLIIELIPSKVNTPVLRGNLLCSDTTATVDISLQTNGTVELYNGVTLVSTATITPNGFDGVATFTSLNLTSGGSYYFVAKNVGQIDSDPTATITVTPCCTAPAITTQPLSQDLCDVTSVNLSVVATGTPPLAYQWKLNNVNIVGANASTLLVTNNGAYSVNVSNSCNDITSNVANITFGESPTGGGSQPAINATVASPYNHTVTFAGTQPFTLSNVIKPSWLSITLAGNVVTISETPTVGDIGSAEYSFDIVNSCGTQSSYSLGGTVVTNCVNVGGGSIAGNLNPVFNVNETYVLSGLTGTAPFNITTIVTGGSIVSGQDTDIVTVKWTTNGTITFNISNCGGSGSKTVSQNVTVITANTEDDSFTIIANNTLTNIVTANDTICSGGITTYELNSDVSHGTLVFNTDGTFEYVPSLNYTGIDSFKYNIKCNGNIVDTSTVNITINPYTAVANDDTFSTPFGVPYNGTVTGNDISCNSGNTYYKLISGSESNGTVNFNNNGAFIFTPNSLSTGSFQYQILCGTSLINAVVIDTATVTINVICTPVTNFDIIGDNLSYIDHQETFTIENINGTPPHTIQWIVGGGNIINGQNTTTLNVVFTQRQNTFVKAIVTNCGGATFEKTKFVTISLPPCCDCC